VRQSNTYVIIFAIILTIILGGLLSLTSVGLKPLQDKQVELDTKKKILGAVITLDPNATPEEVLKLYDDRVKSMLVDVNGNEVTNATVTAEKVDIGKNHKLPKDKRNYPVFMYMNESGQVEAYIMPMFGAGLWDWISGYMALGSDLNTIKGIAFDHKSETPGLGARITEEGVKNRYQGKTIFEGSELVSVEMIKGEGNTGLGPHQVDGMSGATMTAKGVNQMLDNYLSCYLGFIEKNRKAL
jgi:Na+-transporting NADH:ubiquinone oxidoreductase subunit C